MRQMDSDWKKELWKAAWREFAEERNGDTARWKEANLPLFDQEAKQGSADLSAIEVGKALGAIQAVLQEAQK